MPELFPSYVHYSPAKLASHLLNISTTARPIRHCDCEWGKKRINKLWDPDANSGEN